MAGEGESEAMSSEAVKKTTKKVKVRVDLGYIDKRLANPPQRGFCGFPDEVLRHPPESQAELEMRESFARMAVLCKAAYDEEMDILDQYHAYGFAEVEIEVDDAGEESVA